MVTTIAKKDGRLPLEIRVTINAKTKAVLKAKLAYNDGEQHLSTNSKLARLRSLVADEVEVDYGKDKSKTYRKFYDSVYFENGIQKRYLQYRMLSQSEEWGEFK